MIVAVAGLKGGTGKTTAAVNLAVALAMPTRRVLLVDLDAQGSATRWLGGTSDARLVEAFTSGSALEPVATPWGCELVPAGPGLATVERQLAGEPGAEMLVKQAMRAFARRFPVILLDCPPAMSLLVVGALVAADAVLAPVEAAPLALQGLVDLELATEKIRARLNRGLRPPDVLLSRSTRTRAARDVEAAVRGRYGTRVLATVLRESARLREAPARQQPITTYDPEGGAADDVRALAAELVKRWKL